MTDAQVQAGRSGAVRCIVDGSGPPLVRRKVLVFRRLEPGDVRGQGARPMPESPYVEAKVVEIAVGKATHDDMVRLAKRRAEVLDAGESLLHRYDVPGIIIAGAASGFFGTYFDYVPERFRVGLGVAFLIGVVLAFVTRSLRKSAEVAALARWNALPESKEHDRLARELAEAWERFGASIKREHEGFHTVLRVAEGSTAPERLCSIDPRPFAESPPRFDPEDWLPTDGGGVRYEVVDAMGEIVTRALEGVDDVAEEPERPAGTESSAKHAPSADAEPQAEASAAAEASPATESSANDAAPPEAAASATAAPARPPSVVTDPSLAKPAPDREP